MTIRVAWIVIVKDFLLKIDGFQGDVIILVNITVCPSYRNFIELTFKVTFIKESQMWHFKIFYRGLEMFH